MAAHADIVVDQYATFSTALSLTDDNGNVIDLTGYSAYANIKKWYSDTSPIASFTITIPQPQLGQIFLSLSANQTANLWYGRYVYDVVTADTANNITRVVEGILTVTPGVTPG